MHWLFQIIGSQQAAMMKGHGIIHIIVPLFSLLTITVSGSPVIHNGPYSPFVKRDSTSRSSIHHASMDCLHTGRVSQCLRELRQFAMQGYPWPSPGRQKILRNDQNVTDNVRDSLDSLNHMCYIQDRSERCLQQHDVADFCLSSIMGSHRPELDFKFICHHRRRDENLVRSLQCLHKTRLLVMLDFHIANRCGGFHVLDNIMGLRKNAYFYRLRVAPTVSDAMTHLLPLNCLPKHVFTCIKQLIDDHCGAMTADLVHHYILYIQERFGRAFRSAGLSSDICQSDISSIRIPTISRIPQLHGKLPDRQLKMTVPGTALDTPYGWVVAGVYIQLLPADQQCTTLQELYFQYNICVMSSDGKAEMQKFNILQFAHGIIPIPYHGTQCNRLDTFTACWNLLQDTCGPKVRGLEQHATLLVESCKIQSEMDLAGCHWQDMLLPHYIEASQVTTWPLGGQCMRNPMWLDNMHYNTSLVRKDLDKVISLLKPGVEDISRICSQQLGRRVKVLLEKIRYLQHSAFEYTGLLPNPIYINISYPFSGNHVNA